MVYLNIVVHVLTLVIGLDGLAAGAPQKLRELAREQAMRDPTVVLHLPAAPGDYWPKAIEVVAREADVVLLAKLSRIDSYLNSNEDRILTDYGIREPNVIAGRLLPHTTQVAGPGAPPILTVFGGDTVVEGVRIRATDNNRADIKEGGEYLLFLRHARGGGAGRYEIYYGGVFEIVHGAVTPLLKRAGDVFKGTIDVRLENFITRIQSATAVR